METVYRDHDDASARESKSADYNELLSMEDLVASGDRGGSFDGVYVEGHEAVKLSPAASARWNDMDMIAPAPAAPDAMMMEEEQQQPQVKPLVSALRPRRFKRGNEESSSASSTTITSSVSFEGANPDYVRYIDSFDVLEQVGHGMFGQVHRARDRDTGEIVATKKIRLDNEREGFPVTAMREIKILQRTNHVNIIALKEIVSSRASDFNRSRGSVFLVFEYCPFDLTALLACQDVPLLEPHIMCIMKQIVIGLHYAHTNSLLHRDIKPANILITANGVVKIADWGLSRHVSKSSNNASSSALTNRVCTLWYRAPELLLGQCDYTASVDMWAAGCLFMELWVRRAVLQGHCEANQLDLVFNLFGTPTQETWPDWKDNLPLAKLVEFPPRPSTFEERFGRIRKEAKDLFLGLLTLDPRKRLNALDAADHAYFWDCKEVSPCRPEEMPLPKQGSLHELNFKSPPNGSSTTAAVHGGYNQPPPHDPNQHHHHQRPSSASSLNGFPQQGNQKRLRRTGLQPQQQQKEGFLSSVE